MEFVFELDGFLQDVYCDHLVKKFDTEAKLFAGTTKGGYQPDVKRSTDTSWYDSNDLWLDETAYFVIKMKKALALYGEYLVNKGYYKDAEWQKLIKTTFIKTPQMQKTEPGGFYVWHQDGGLNDSSRAFTFIIYLKDVEEGIGGCTEFEGKVVQPKKGKLCVFPAQWPFFHRGQVLEKGTKYILTCFGYNDESLS